MLLTFWGKTPSRPAESPQQFHPAIHHMLDVALVAEALVSDQATPRLRHALTRAWAGVPIDQLLAWLPFLVAMHDLGKISAAFQGQARDERSQVQRQRLEESGIIFPPRYERSPYHAEVSAVWLHRHLERHEPGIAGELTWVLRDAMGGHHGRFIQEDARVLGRRLRASEKEVTSRWEEWRDEAYTLLRATLQPPGGITELGAPHRLRPATAALTGFLILCDWIGSNEHHFPASPDVPVDSYVHHAREHARVAIKQAGLQVSRPSPSYFIFPHLFPHISTPRPLQQAIDDLPEEALIAPLLAVIEAPTGEGKTEAALALARRLAAREGTDELFCALPTMATSNQMYGRISRFYNALYGAAVRLTHSQATVQEEELHRAALAEDSDPAEPQAASKRAAIEWFAGAKKAMLAPFGVGTVDQVELAGLNVRHYPLRLFALAGKVVIIDEVHAYDAYMSTILEHTLAWLASLGTSVLLLSATLPSTRHHALAASYLKGLDCHRQASEIPSSLPYPSISLYHAGEPHRATPGVFRPDQRFTLQWSHRLEPEQDARYLLDLVREGGAVARIVNRVDDAQAIYQALKEMLPANQRILLHARLPLWQRKEREEQVEQLVGKETDRTPNQSLIIIGTQVLEQSLDYDVDVMVSDFAPVDLLLQRAGRLHRHIKERDGKRPPRHTCPLLDVVLPQQADGVPDWKLWAQIYAPYILWRTWEVLCRGKGSGKREIVLPRDYRPLIEAVYCDEPPLPTDVPYAEAVATARAKLQEAQGSERSHARKQLTPHADAAYNTPITYNSGFDFVEDEDGALSGWQIAKTRLGDRVTVVPLYRHDDRLTLDAGGTSELSRDVPPWRADELKEVLSHSVSISNHGIIAALRTGTRRDLRWPWPEREVPPLLRSLFPLVLNLDGTAVFDKQTVRLDPDLGLIIEKR
jgi:CRISPR-associated endonuclease/helicase Cas3